MSEAIVMHSITEKAIDLLGNRRLRVMRAAHGDVVTILLAIGWDDGPVFPLGAQTIALPVERVPELIEALRLIGGAE